MKRSVAKSPDDVESQACPDQEDDESKYLMRKPTLFSQAGSRQKFHAFTVFLSKYSKLWEFIFSSLLLLSANYLYTSSERRCKLDSFPICLMWFIHKNLYIWALKLGSSSVIFAGIIIRGLNQRQLIPLIFCFGTLMNVMYLLFYFDDTLGPRTYGRAFAITLGTFMVLWSVAYLIYCFFRLCFKFMPVITSIFLVLAFVVYPVHFYFYRVKDSCAGWAKGLGGEEIDNSVGCKIELPEVCTLDILEGFADGFWWTECSTAKVDRELMDKVYPNAPIIGLPRFEHAPTKVRHFQHLQNYVYENSVGLESFDELQAKDLEIFIDQRDRDDVKVHIDVKRNETLVKERAKMNDTGILSKNVLVIMIDTVARPRLYAKLKNTVAWLEKYYNGKSAEREAFQFFKFHSVAPFTIYNTYAAYFGEIPNTWKKPPADPPQTYAQQYKDKGYILGRTQQYCDVSSNCPDSNKRGYTKDVPFDHEGSGIACDVHYGIDDDSMKIFKGGFSPNRRCLYGKDMYEHTFDYGDKFWRAYPNEKKLLWLDFLDGHEPTQEVVKLLDDPMVKFLDNLDKDNLLQDTTILFWSDHGNHIPIAPYNMNGYLHEQERALPFLFVLLPPSLIPKYRDNLKANSQKLVSAFEIYNFLMTVPLGESSPHFKKSFLNALPSYNCKDIKIFTTFQNCFCSGK